MAQALLLRRSRDFASVEDYQSWVRATIEREHNHLRGAKLAEEKQYLRPLPQAALPCHTVMLARVRRWSTIRVQGRTYSVPARLIGEQVRILVHADRLDVYYRERAVASLPRLRGRGDARIDYHHVIFSLVRKPGAFARYRWREELFPSVTFRRAYDALLSRWREHGESAVEQALTTLLERDEGFDAERVRQMVQPPRPPLPQLVLEQPDPSRYDALLGQVTS